MNAASKEGKTENWLCFDEAFSGGNAIISPNRGDDFYFTLIGNGTIKKQNEIGKRIVHEANCHADLLKALEELLDDKSTTYSVRASRARAAISRAKSAPEKEG